MSNHPATTSPAAASETSAEGASRALERYRLNDYPGEWGYVRRSPAPGHDVLGVGSRDPYDRYTVRVNGFFRRDEFPELIAFLTAVYAASESI